MSLQKKYLQIHDRIASSICGGSYSAGDKLPTESELTARYCVSRQTVRRALDLLAGEGLIQKVQGSGSYISETMHTAKKTMRIAVVASSIDTYIFPHILSGIEDVLSRNHYSIQLMVTSNSIAKEREILEYLSAGGVDGILAEGTKTALPNPNLSFYRAFAGSNTPLVFFGGYYPELFGGPAAGIRYVVMDDYRGAFEITSDLIARGHLSIGGIFKSDDIRGVRRFSGFIDALANADLKIADGNVLWFCTETAAALGPQLNASKLLTKCTALVCYNDEIVREIFAYTEKGTEPVPSLRSFDGICTPRESTADFLSYSHPKEAFGRAAAQELLSIIEGKQNENLVLPWGGGDSPA